MSTPDVTLDDCGSVVILQPLTSEAREWLVDSCQTEPWMWLGGGLHVEPRYAAAIVDGLVDDGFLVGGPS